MGSIVSTFHVEWQLLLAQVINFTLVVGVLWYFAFRPLNNLLTKRRLDIEAGLEDAKQAKQARATAEQNANQIIGSAKQEANTIVAESHDQTVHMIQTAKAEAETERLKILARAEADMVKEREASLNTIKQASAEMIVAGVEKVLRQTFDKKTQSSLIQSLK